MHDNGFIRIDSELGKKIGLTSEWFTNATIWDNHPKKLFVTQLRPVEGKEEEAFRWFLEHADKIYTPIELTAPVPLLRKLAEEYGYDSAEDVAGTPYMTNSASKFLKNL